MCMECKRKLTLCSQTGKKDSSEDEPEEIVLSYPTEEELLQLRTTKFSKASGRTKQLWYWYAAEATTTIPSAWKKKKSTMANTLLHDALTVSDEAYIISVIVNYKEKFEQAAKKPRKVSAGRRKGETQWTEVMIKRFAKCYRLVKEARQCSEAASWETAFQEYFKGLKASSEEDEGSTEEEEDRGSSEVEIPMDDMDDDDE